MQGKRINLLIIFFVISFIVLGFLLNVRFSRSQPNGESLTVDTAFQMVEFANFTDEELDIDALNITLPSSNWNITGMELSLTDIRLGKEIVPIEEGGSSFKTIYKGTKGYGVQLNITEETILFGVQIYGYVWLEKNITASNVYVQINGFDQGTFAPNNTVYGEPVLINMTNIPNWYIQTFSSPISLDAGQYYLVVNGSEFLTSDNSDYQWYLNEEDSNHTSLYIAKYSSGVWSEDGQGKPFRHKLIQRIDLSYNPEEINMTLNLDGQTYNITDGISPGTGNLTVSDLDLFPNSSNCYLPIHHNQSVDIAFNVTYSINLRKSLNSYGTVLIKDNQDSVWTITPSISRNGFNYSVKFDYPQDWFNLIVRREEVDITSQIQENPAESYIIIPNNTITNGASWEILANSTNVNFDLDVPRTEFRTEQELKFSLSEPIKSGNYTFVLYDPLDYEVSRQTKSIPSDNSLFSYNISSFANDGTYISYIYWVNGTHTGVETQEFQVTVPFTIDPIMILIIAVISGVAIAVSFSSYKLIKKAKRTRDARIEEIYNKCSDVLNLNYVMVVEKRSSLNVYEQAFTSKNIDPTLISGFLEAIRSFGLELTSSADETQTIKLEYKKSKVLMSEFKDFRIILVMNDLPSQKFLDSVRMLSHEIEDNYSQYLQEFKGNLIPFITIEELLKKHLNTSFLYPLKILGTGKVKIAQDEKSMIGRAVNAMKRNKLTYFYTTHLMLEKELDSKDIETIFNLIDKKIFQPVM